jgi:peptide/nickel transport system permease protein
VDTVDPGDSAFAALPGLPPPVPVGAARPRRIHPLAWFIFRRLAAGVLMLAVVSVVVFAATEILPGDAATAILGRDASPDAVAAMRHELGLDRPVVAQYLSWVGGLLHGDLGRSLTSGLPVSDLIGSRIMNTLILACVASFVMIPLAVALGVAAGRRPGGGADTAITWVSLGMIAVPEFVLGTLLVLLFAVKLQLLPAVSLLPTDGGPLDAPSALVLPVATLVIVGVAYIIRMVRAGVVEVMASDYVQMARLNGIGERRVVMRHGLRNALAPTVQVVALTLQWLIGGLFIVETVFQYPGIGQGLVQSVVARDIPVVQAVAMLIATTYILITIVADIAVVLLVPKLRTSL